MLNYLKNNKKRYYFLLTIAISLIFCCFLSCSKVVAVEAKDQVGEYKIEQIRANLPEINVFLDSPQISKDNIKAKINAQEIKIDKVSSLDDSNVKTHYIILVDVSDSITSREMFSEKKALKSLSENLKPNEDIRLITFGEKISVLLNGSESSNIREKKINGLSNNQVKTRFFDGISKATDIVETSKDNNKDRYVAICLTDGADYTVGGHTASEALQELEDSELPMYSLGFDTGSKEALDGLGVLSRKSKGDIQIVDEKNIQNKFNQMIKYTRSIKVVELQAISNTLKKENSNLELNILYNNKEINLQRRISNFTSKSDNTKPKIVKIKQLKKTDGIEIIVDKPLVNVDAISSYIIKDKSGKRQKIQKVTVRKNEEDCDILVYFTKKPYSGKYTINFVGITDLSKEHHSLNETKAFNYKGTSKVIWLLNLIFVQFWWIVAIVVVLFILIIVWRKIKKRKLLVKVDGKIGFGDSLEVKHHFKTAEIGEITLIVTDINGVTTEVNGAVKGSFFIGRHSSNNLSFEDSSMSRQHFVISIEEGKFYLTNLATTNVTKVNGVGIGGKVEIKNGDIIEAGHEKFEFKKA
ncbi:MAG: FHA domain-containing protein [Lachnospiraceae bacterium]|nr:FHA domain-containing protein [Lachnospiraceae bacterium]